MQVWYQQTADSLENLMLICERRVLKTFNGELPLWFKTGIQFTHNTDYNSQLYAKQEEIKKKEKGEDYMSLSVSDFNNRIIKTEKEIDVLQEKINKKKEIAVLKAEMCAGT